MMVSRYKLYSSSLIDLNKPTEPSIYRIILQDTLPKSVRSVGISFPISDWMPLHQLKRIEKVLKWGKVMYDVETKKEEAEAVTPPPAPPTASTVRDGHFSLSDTTISIGGFPLSIKF